MQKHILQLLKSYLPSAIILIIFGLIIAFLASLFNLEIARTFFTSPNISGWDGATHEAVLNIYSQNIFPSTWGWIGNWQGGMPFPVLYPPLMYIIGGFLTQIIGNSVLAYKFLSAIILLFISISVFLSLIHIFKKIYPQLGQYSSNNKWLYFTIIISASIILGVNSGAPGPKSIFFGSMVGQNLSMIMVFPALFALTSRSKFMFSIGVLSWMIIYISNIHTALCAGFFAFFILLFQHKKDFLFYIKRFILIQSFGLIFASFWIFPMLGSYEYFSGSNQRTPLFNLYLLKSLWLYVIVAIYGYYVSNKQRKIDNGNIFRWISALFVSMTLIIGLDIVQQTYNVKLPLPIYIHRWYETFFFFLSVPFTYALLYISQQYFIQYSSKKNIPTASISIAPSENHSKKKHIHGPIFVILIFVLSLSIYINVPINRDYFNPQSVSYIDIVSMTDKIGSSTVSTMVQSNFLIGHEGSQDTIDAELGKRGGLSTFSALRESGINSSFYRMLRNNLSFNSENWNLTNFYKTNYTRTINPEHSIDLYRHMGIGNLVILEPLVPGESSGVRFATTTAFKLSTTTPGYVVASIDKVAPFASMFKGDVALFVGQNGFRERKKTDLDYTRFQETMFENHYFKNFFPINVGIVPLSELKTLADNSKFTIITDYSLYPEQELSDFLAYTTDHFSIQSHTVFLYSDDSEIYRRLIALHGKDPNIIPFKSVRRTFPFDALASKIKKVSTSTVSETPVEILLKSDSNLSLEIPPVSKKQKTKEEVSWVFIRQSFHPGWNIDINNMKQKGYMAAPGFTIVPIPTSSLEATSTLTMTFPPSKLFYIGHGATIFGLLLLALYSIWGYIRHRKN